jgi:hypothetical protein
MEKDRIRDSSADTTTVLRLDILGSIADRGKSYFSSVERSDRLWGPPSLLSDGYRGGFPGREENLATHLHLAPRSRMVELYHHSPMCLRRMALNWSNTDTIFVSCCEWNRTGFYLVSYRLLFCCEELLWVYCSGIKQLNMLIDNLSLCLDYVRIMILLHLG